MNMKLNMKLEKMKKDYETIRIPEHGMEGLMKSIERGKAENRKQRNRRRRGWIGGGVAAALVLGVLLPNMNRNVAMAMEKMPVIGGVVRVVTLGRYEFNDERHNANVEIPQVEVENGESEAAGSLNQDVETYINTIVEDFKQSLEEDYVKSIDISYETVTDTADWFTLRLDVTEVQASGYMYSKFYHIDKKTGTRAELKDLFPDGADYVTVLSDAVKTQMREQMRTDESKMYFIDTDMPETEFQEIKADQNFYRNEDGQIVLVFDEYEVAPGYMGMVEFVIPDEVTESLMR